MTLSLKRTQWTKFKFTLKKAHLKLKKFAEKHRLLEVLLNVLTNVEFFQIYAAQEFLNPKRWIKQVHMLSMLHIT